MMRRSHSGVGRPSRRWPRFEVEPFEPRLLLTAAVQLTTDKTGVSSQLLALSTGAQTATTVTSPGSLVYDAAGRVAVEITAKRVAALAKPLARLGFVTTAADGADHLIEGYLPVGSIAAVGGLSKAGLMGVLAEARPMLSVGAVTTQGASVIESDRVQSQTGNGGAGQTVGVISDSYNDLGGAATDVATGDLPPNVRVLQDLPTQGTDEGRAMLQIVHDVAPAANLAFATGDNGDASFAQNIVALAKPVAQGGAGATVIADDLTYYDEPFFQDGIIAQAVDTADTTYGAAYLAAAGNFATQSYDSTSVSFASSTIAGISSAAQPYYNFGTAASPQPDDQVTLAPNQAMLLEMQWDQPFYTTAGVTTTLAMYLLNAATGAVVASATANNIASQTPSQVLSYENGNGNPQYTTSVKYDLVIARSAGTTPGRLRFVNYGFNDYGDLTFSAPLTGPAVTPHAAAADAVAVGAVPYYGERTPESFTSVGPATILFDASGNRLTTPQVRPEPALAAPDGVATTVPGFGSFYGTSAATPHAAGVAALVLAAHPTDTPAQVDAAMESTAFTSPYLPYTSQLGAGLIDAYRAVVAPTATPAATPLAEGFEAGSLGADWNTFTSNAGRVSVRSGNDPADASGQLVLDADLTNTYQYLDGDDVAILHVNAAGLYNVTLAFDQKRYAPAAYAADQSDHPIGFTSFTGTGDNTTFDADLVALSVTGGNYWYVLEDPAGPSSTTSYQTEVFNLSQIAAADGITLTADTQIAFSYFNYFALSAPNGGLAFDDLSVTGTASPAALVLTGPAFTLKADADGQHVDVYTGTSATGTPSQTALLSSLPEIAVNGTGLASSLTVDFSAGSPLQGAALVYAASGPASSLLLVGDGGQDSVTTYATNVSFHSNVAGGGNTLSFSNLAAFTFAGGSGQDQLTENAQPDGTATVEMTNGTPQDTVTVKAGTFTVPAGPPTATVPQPFTLGTLTVNSGAAVVVPTAATHAGRTVLVLNSLSLSGVNGNNSSLDLGGNDMVLESGDGPRLAMWLATGFAGGTWAGGLLTSSAAAADPTRRTALGWLRNANGAAPLMATFDGQAVTAAAYLVKYTYYGDANLDGVVNAADYARTDAGLAGSLTGWANGDFNYDNVIDGSDYALIDNGFNTQTTGL